MPFFIDPIGIPSSIATPIEAAALKTLCFPGRLILNLCFLLFFLSYISKLCFPALGTILLI